MSDADSLAQTLERIRRLADSDWENDDQADDQARMEVILHARTSGMYVAPSGPGLWQVDFGVDGLRSGDLTFGQVVRVVYSITAVRDYSNGLDDSATADPE